ncbi:MAG: hypothetical protein ACI8R4_000243, partial [Paracoccaceae bacterium]
AQRAQVSAKGGGLGGGVFHVGRFPGRVVKKWMLISRCLELVKKPSVFSSPGWCF